MGDTKTVLNGDDIIKHQAALAKTVMYVAKAHEGQFRKGNNLPYIVHPLAVLVELSNWGITKLVTLKAGVAHDVREERPDITPEALAKAIGVKEAAIVEELSFFPDPTSNLADHVQKAKYMETFMEKSLDALVIKVADRVRNSWDFYHTDAAYAHKYWKKAVPLFDAMFSRLVEIEAEFGNEVMANMKFARDTLNRMLVR